MSIQIREAMPSDIPRMQVVRNSVKENMLSDPALVPDADVLDFISRRGKGWVSEEDGKLTGFAIADLQDNNVWALFVQPGHDGKGAGQQLQRAMLNWYFSQTKDTLWLGTAPGTKAERFYRKSGWREAGMHGTKEIKFEMTFAEWEKLRSVI